MDDLVQDLRVAVRGLLRTPGFALVAMLSLGVGIGAVTTIYNWTDRMILHPLPLVPEASRLVEVSTRAPGGGTWSVSYPSYRDWAERNRVFSGLTVTSPEQVGVRFDGGVEPAYVLLTTDGYFDVLGVRALHGRTFQSGEESRAAPVVVLGHDYWERMFDADPQVVGRSIVLNGVGYDVIGVLPPRFGGSYIGLNLDMYALVTTAPALLGSDPLRQRGSQWLEALGRLKPGVSLAQARDDMRRVGTELDAIFPDNANEGVVELITDAQGPPRTMRPVFLALLGVTAMVLLIACANVANLLLARASGRRKEIGVRLALGAGRARLVRQLLTESALLAVGGGGIGLLLAYAGRNGMMAIVPPTPFPIGMDFPVNGRVLAVAALVSAMTVAVFGLWPAVRASRVDLVPVLKDLPTGGRARSRARTVLVAAQVALAVVSLACAGLFLRAIENSRSLDPGFTNPDGLLLVDTDLRVAGLDETTGPVVVDRVLERIRAVPGVERAAVGSFIPLGWSCCRSSSVAIDGYVPQPDENTSLVYGLVSSGYFETFGIDIVAGRSFTSLDRSGENVAIVNETFARRFWPGLEPLGRRFRQSGRDFTVVGVARDGRYRQLTDAPFPLIYRPYGQGHVAGLTFLIRTRGNPKLLTETLRREVRAEHADMPFVSARTMSENMMQATIGQQIGSRMLAVFGALALLLSAVGIHGVMAYSVSQRAREIGVRVALGAARRDIARMVVRQGLRITAVGLVTGTALALGAGRLMRSLLLGVSPSDFTTFAGVAVVLLLVAVVACLVPARRAASVDPVRAFKAE